MCGAIDTSGSPSQRLGPQRSIKTEKVYLAHTANRVAEKHTIRRFQVLNGKDTFLRGCIGLEKMTAEDSGQYARAKRRGKESAFAQEEEIADGSLCPLFSFVQKEDFIEPVGAGLGIEPFVSLTVCRFVPKEDILRGGAFRREPDIAGRPVRRLLC